MINKIEMINNIGSYKNFSGESLDDFSRFNLIYGENGSGKTILSKLVSLYSNKEEDIYKDELISELFNKDSVLKINIEGQSLSCTPGNLHKYNIHVFNSSFVANNLYDGANTYIKKFKVVDITKVQSGEITRLSNEIKEMKTIIGDNKSGLVQKKEGNDKVITNLQKSIRDEFNKKIIGKNLTNIRNPSKFSDRNESDIEYDIINQIKEYNLVVKDSFEYDLKMVNELSKEKETIHIDIRKLEFLLNKKIENRAKQHVVTKFDEINNVLKQYKPIEWLESGITLLKHRRNNNENYCPLCESDISLSIDEIINDYLGYFDKEFSNLKTELDTNKSELENIKKILHVRNDQILNELIKKYSYLFTDDFISKDIEKTINKLVKLISNLLLDIENKKNDPKYQGENDFDNILNLIELYNSYVVEFRNTCNKLVIYFQNGTKIEKIIENIKNLYIEKFGALIKKVLKDKNPLENLNKLEIEIINLYKEIEIKHEIINEEYKKLKLESTYINEYLKKLNITRFTVNVDDNFEVNYISGVSKKSLKHSLSEGEKTTLAFAYFLSKIKFESAAKISECIIYIDDPISSLDDDRIFYTSNTIIQEFRDVGQIFISSHSLRFLRVILTFAKHPFSNKLRLYQIKNPGNSNITNAPAQLTNFISNYYEKLQDILDYVNDISQHSDVSNRIPNSIRVVLETFLSFKFGYLKKHKGNIRSGKEDIGTTPGLSDMIIMLRNETPQMNALINQLNEFNGINPQNFFTELNYIVVHLTNIFSHGNISTIDYINPPITENELKAISNKTLSIMQFLDWLNIEAIKETAVTI